MASAKFLEEALSTDVDESAVNAIVGSLETQLVTATPAVSSQQGSTPSVNQNHMNSGIPNGGTVASQKHNVSNCGSGSMNILLNSDVNKTITTSSLQSSNIVHSNANTVVTSLHGGVPASGYVNQVTSTASQSTLTNISKSHESVKIVYPSSSQSSGGVNINNRVAFPAGALPNGNLALAPLSSHTVLNSVTSSVQSVVSHTHSQTISNVSKPIGSLISVDHGKQGTLVIKAGGNTNVTQGTPLGAGVVSVPMTVNTSGSLSGTHVNTAVGTTATSGMSGVVTLAKPMTHTLGASQTIVGNSPTILPANVQIVNVNAVRPGTPVQPGQKGIPPRVVIGAPHMVGARAGQAGQITLQTLQGLQPGTQGHLLLKTENGQFQLLRVGPAPNTPGSSITPNSAAGTLNSGTTYRIQSVPAHGTVTVATTASAVIQPTQPPVVATQNATVQRNAMDTTKEKCRKFLANLLELSSREPKSVERNVRTLIQELIDTKVEPEEFCDRLERLLNASPQPCLIGFLKKSLPLLRQSLVIKELVIEGIRPPPHTVVFSLPNSANMVPQLQTQIRPQTATASTTTQVRLMTPVNSGTQSIGMNIPRPTQQRLVTPVRPQTPTVGPRMMMGTTPLRQQTPITSATPTIVTSTAASTMRVSAPSSLPAPPLHIRQPTQVQIRAPISTTTVTTTAAVIRPPAMMHTIKTTATIPNKSTVAMQSKPPAPSLLPKPTAKEKEKKSFSHAGYTVYSYRSRSLMFDPWCLHIFCEAICLEQGQLDLVRTNEYLSKKVTALVYKTQINDWKVCCADHMTPSNCRIASYGLEEPSSDVAALISHAAQERLKTIVEKLGVIAEHRIDLIKVDPRYEVTQDVKGQLKFLEELDRVERKRHEEQERELLLRAAKSRSKSEDPEQAKLKAKAKEMQRAEMEELRQREANLTALQAIGPRKKQKLEPSGTTGSLGQVRLQLFDFLEDVSLHLYVRYVLRAVPMEMKGYDRKSTATKQK
uniref:TAFH domain-containing protein n=1 Tax=Timema shepardi TaxID=629360 RepID=A0A7R9FWG9_TIMSH|nr:unnamed protein product [Timema shepardi]